MRGVAAIAVLAFHIRGSLAPVFGGKTFFGGGYLAVDLFFVLSGFVIAHAYDARLAAGLGFREFASKRAARLLPMIWVGVAIGAAHNLAFVPDEWPRTLLLTGMDAAIVPNVFYPELTLFPLNGAEWSLFFEVAANLVFAAAFLWLGVRGMTAVVAVSAAGLLIAAMTLGNLDGGYRVPTLWVGCARVGFGFFLGIALYRGRRFWFHRVPHVPPWIVLSLCFGLLALPVPTALRPAFDLGFVFFASPLLVMAGSRAEPTPAGRHVATALAALSYPLYAIHLPVRAWLRSMGATGEATVAVMAALILVSWALAYHYEAPMRRRLEGLFRPRPPRPIAEVAIR